MVAAVSTLALLATVAWVLTDVEPHPERSAAPHQDAPQAAADAEVGRAQTRTRAAQSAPAAAPAARAKLDCNQPHGDVATVRGEAIAAAAFCADLTARAGTLRPDAPPALHNQAQDLLNQWVDARLVAAALAAEQLQVTAQEVEAALSAARAATPEQLSATLEDQLRSQLRQRLELRKLLDAHADLTLPASAAQAEFERHADRWQRSTIFKIQPYVARLAPSDGSAQGEAGKRAAAGFAQAVPTDGPDKAAEVWHLRAMPPFELTADGTEPELEAAVSTLQPGSWSGPLRLRGGWAVVHNLSRRDAPPRSFAAVREEIERTLVGQRRMAEQARILRDLRSQTKVTVLTEL